MLEQCLKALDVWTLRDGSQGGTARHIRCSSGDRTMRMVVWIFSQYALTWVSIILETKAVIVADYQRVE